MIFPLEQWLLVRYALLLIGICCILAGIITVWLPLPIGIPLMLVGATILLRTSKAFQHWLRMRRANHPRLNRAMTRVGRRLPWPYRRMINRTVPSRVERARSEPGGPNASPMS